MTRPIVLPIPVPHPSLVCAILSPPSCMHPLNPHHLEPHQLEPTVKPAPSCMLSCPMLLSLLSIPPTHPLKPIRAHPHMDTVLPHTVLHAHTPTPHHLTCALPLCHLSRAQGNKSISHHIVTT